MEITAVRFEHETLGQRVIFGSGAAAENLAREVERLGAPRVMLVAGESNTAAADLAPVLRPVVWFHDVAQHVPADVADRARRAAADAQVELVVSIGGGSATGLAKAIALTTGLPIVAVPTTFAGSEATNVWGITESSRKLTGVDARVLPATVVYDAALTLGLPRELVVASGLNAIAHGVDSLWAPRADPITQALALEGIRALQDGLRAITAHPTALEGRERALYGGYLSAVAFASAGSGLHHKICHVLGGSFGLPHAQTHAIVLPTVLAFNGPAVPDLEARAAAAFGAPTADGGLRELRDELEAPRALRDYGFAESDIDEAAAIILPQVPDSNPRPVAKSDLVAILTAAWAGTPLDQKEDARA
ncbi:maleylacetate reductase [Herbiconiux sp. CPCC 205763]|uniref:Maleylacetate reductase n=1 Tax=Herbiconiux aconitum TaxID=2970913 RepID=A0ABT2GMV7_9MICO|nr:maleylacetate reductase [Herbiconiux aconitum]MCS5717577.1 maleylacetate reductase [Herbiconiux aconitum]